MTRAAREEQRTRADDTRATARHPRRAGVDSPAFVAAGALLESATRMTGPETRGTLRLTLRDAGLDVATVRAEQIAALATTALVGELLARGIPDATGVGRGLADAMLASPGAEPEAPRRRGGTALY